MAKSRQQRTQWEDGKEDNDTVELIKEEDNVIIDMTTKVTDMSNLLVLRCQWFSSISLNTATQTPSYKVM